MEVFDSGQENLKIRKSKISKSLMSYETLCNEFEQLIEQEQWSDASDHFKLYNCGISKFITIINNRNEESPIFKCDWSSEPVFIKLSNKELKDTRNEIYLRVKGDHMMSGNQYQWGDKLVSYDFDSLAFFMLDWGTMRHKACHDYNGWENTTSALKKVSNEMMHNYNKSNFPVKKESRDLFSTIASIKAINLNKIYHGYVPSIGQLYLIRQFTPYINFVFDKINKNFGYEFCSHLNLYEHVIWSSSSVDKNKAWLLNKGIVNFGEKPAYAETLPIFMPKD